MTQKRALSFGGLQKTTLVDYPGEVACTFFVSGCNFRCSFCYNSALVLEQDTGVSISEAEALNFLAERKNFLDGVCLTGGEPLLYYPAILGFLKQAKALGYKIKLDTNGSFPAALKEIIEQKLVDYIAMDIKTSPEKYGQATGVAADVKKIAESIAIIKASDVEYEFRTTTHAGIDEEDFEKIGQWLNGSKRYFLQGIKLNLPRLDEGFRTTAYGGAELRRLADRLRPFVEQVGIRN